MKTALLDAAALLLVGAAFTLLLSLSDAADAVIRGAL